ncbi:MAG: hypothetical protein AB1439_03880 [candidate division FCPU426 bacterium]
MMGFKKPSAETAPVAINKATAVITSVLGVLLSLASFEHGLFETLQGGRPTGKLIIQAIGEAQRWWLYGTEEALTILPVFWLTGLCAMAISLVAAFWSIRSIRQPRGATVFLLLFILVTLVGGGIGHIVFFTVIWAYATRIRRPLTGWRKILPPGLRKLIAPWWPYVLAVAGLCWLMALEIAVFGYFPGLSEPDVIFALCWYLLLAVWLLVHLAYFSGFASDLEDQEAAASIKNN